MMYTAPKVNAGMVLAMPAVRYKMKEWLERHDVSAYSVAKEVGISLQTMYRITNNQVHTVNLETLARIMAYLRSATGQEVTFNDLLEFDPDLN